MPNTVTREAVASEVESSLARAAASLKRYRILDTGLLVASIVACAVSAALAGRAGASGELSGFEGWSALCMFVAVVSLVGAIAGGLHKSFRVSDHVASATSCIAALRALDLGLKFEEAPAEVAKKFRELTREHPDWPA